MTWEGMPSLNTASECKEGVTCSLSHVMLLPNKQPLWAMNVSPLQRAGMPSIPVFDVLVARFYNLFFNFSCCTSQNHLEQ